MKPSTQSHFFRLLSKVLAAYLASKGGVEEWRKISNPSEKPTVPHDVQLQRIKIGNIPAEWLIPAQVEDAEKTILYFHGGAWLFGWYNTHRMLVGQIAKQARKQVLAVDYRLAPEYPFPAALDDSLAAYRNLVNSGIAPKRIVVAGDSAGGNLTLVLMLALKKAGDPLPAAGVCLSPVTDMAWTGESMRTKKGIDPIFPEGASTPLASSIHTEYIRSEDPRNPLISPLYADLCGLPPILLHVGGDEILLDDSVRMAERLRAAGGQATLVVWKGMWHVFQAFAPFVPEAGQSIRQIGDFVRKNQRD